MFIKRLVTARPQIIKDYDTLCHIVTWLEYFRDVMERLDVFYTIDPIKLDESDCNEIQNTTDQNEEGEEKGSMKLQANF